METGSWGARPHRRSGIDGLIRLLVLIRRIPLDIVGKRHLAIRSIILKKSPCTLNRTVRPREVVLSITSHHSFPSSKKILLRSALCAPDRNHSQIFSSLFNSRSRKTSIFAWSSFPSKKPRGEHLGFIDDQTIPFLKNLPDFRKPHPSIVSSARFTTIRRAASRGSQDVLRSGFSATVNESQRAS